MNVYHLTLVQSRLACHRDWLLTLLTLRQTLADVAMSQLSALSAVAPIRFYGKFRDEVHQVDLMRRMVKEERVRFDGTLLFPERRTYTVNDSLSD